MRSLIRFCLLVFAFGILFAAREDFKIRSVTFEGNMTCKARTLHRVMISRPSQFLIPVHYRPELLESDLEALATYYRQRGFLAFEHLDHEVQVDSSRKRVDIQIRFNEGPRTYLESVGLVGNAVFSDSLLGRSLKLKAGDPLDADAIRQSSLRMLRSYADSGYLDASVDHAWRLGSADTLALLDFNIQEGPQIRVGDIRLEGLDKTGANVVRRELTFEEGEIARYSKLMQTQRALYLTGLFETVFVEPRFGADRDSTLRAIAIEVQEIRAGSFDVAVGYGSVERLRIKSSFLQSNLGGTARKIGVNGRLSSLYRVLEASFTDPRVRDSQWRFDANLKREFQFQPTYGVSTYGLRMALRRNLSRRWSATVALKNEASRLFDVKVDSLAELTSADIQSLQGRMTYDSRNNLFNPTDGIFAEINHEIAGGPLQKSNRFNRSRLRLGWYQPAGERGTLASGFDIEILHGRTDRLAVSINERLYAGGPNSIRGYAYRSISPRDAAGTAYGGLLRITWNVLEWRVPIYRTLYLAPFVDTGNVWRSSYEAGIRHLKWSAGSGLHIRSSLGIARVDVAYPLSPFTAWAEPRVTFSLGYAF